MDKEFGFQLNGDFVVCSLFEEQDSVVEKRGILLYNKIEEGFQKINKFKIEKLNFKTNIDFPFEENDIVVVCSTGTVVNLNNKKLWLFQPEHILAKIEKKKKKVYE